MNNFPTKIDGIGIALMTIAGFWFIFLVGPLYADSMPLLQVGEPFPNATKPDVTYIFTFNNTYQIEKSDDKIFGIIDISGIITTFTGGVLLILVYRLIDWARSRHR